MRKRASNPTARSPAPLSSRSALSRIAELVGRGHDAARLRREAEALIAALRQIHEPDQLRELLDEMREQLDAGIEAAEDTMAEADGDGAAKAATRSLAALAAARDTFARGAS
ncbi:hypothetical protein [Roseomonas marmotae]|uniref:Uncharacterized protein n=1 Tax=Roseomonas marmotae TaxID=2768161 RepID=A0ABS3KC83_9PROT|nr:hypothetical protein [Roseomonas marmotae]MBO1075076.1 hypothetical protein [Roseomonas marmotae]QTI79895.1 hypothetical protein IAI58_03670 [Roseomonas marmotae]